MEKKMETTIIMGYIGDIWLWHNTSFKSKELEKLCNRHVDSRNTAERAHVSG